MQLLSALLLSEVLLSISAQVSEEDIQRSHQRYADSLRHDGVKRVMEVNMANFERLLKKYRLVYVLFWVDSNESSEQLSPKDRHIMEIVAQVFSKHPVKIATCEIMANQKLAMAADVKYTGMVKIFNTGRASTYAGQRTPDVIIPYLQKMLESSGQIISSRSEKKTYDAIELPKVIAYMQKDSEAEKEYMKASAHFHPMTLFFVVHDAKLAKSFQLKKLNSIHMVKPYEKSLAFPAKTKITESSLVKFLRDNRRQRLTKMLLENIHEIWAIDLVGYAVPIFAAKNTEDGKAFLSMGKSIAKHFEKHENLTFIWIDPNLFPTMQDYWRTSFEIEPMHYSIGVVDIHKQTSTWFSVPEVEDLKMEKIKKWLYDVIAGKIQLVSMKPYNPPKPDGEANTIQEDDDINDEL